jgi:hypothetical protein
VAGCGCAATQESRPRLRGSRATARRVVDDALGVPTDPQRSVGVVEGTVGDGVSLGDCGERQDVHDGSGCFALSLEERGSAGAGVVDLVGHGPERAADLRHEVRVRRVGGAQVGGVEVAAVDEVGVAVLDRVQVPGADTADQRVAGAVLVPGGLGGAELGVDRGAKRRGVAADGQVQGSPARVGGPHVLGIDADQLEQQPVEGVVEGLPLRAAGRHVDSAEPPGGRLRAPAGGMVSKEHGNWCRISRAISAVEAHCDLGSGEASTRCGCSWPYARPGSRISRVS